MCNLVSFAFFVSITSECYRTCLLHVDSSPANCSHWDFARAHSTIGFVCEFWHTRINFAYN